MTEKLFDCDVCESSVVLKIGPGRKHEFRQKLLDVPDDFSIATCEECGETYMTLREAQALEEYFTALK